MGFVLRKPVQVAGDGYPPNSPLKTIPAGTPLEDIAASELQQLVGGHFHDADTREQPSDDVNEELGAVARQATVFAGVYAEFVAAAEAKGLAVVGLDLVPDGPVARVGTITGYVDDTDPPQPVFADVRTVRTVEEV